jgi:uncharacterized protein (TIGR02001 family)
MRRLEMKNTKHLVAILATTLSATATLPASAEQTPNLPGEFTANVALTTDYIYRGVTQTSEGPAIQGGFDYALDDFYAGVWASSLDFDDDSSSGIEIDYYAGFAPSLGRLNFDLGVLYYTYPDSRDEGAEQDFLEFYAGVETSPVEQLSFEFKVSYSPEFYGETGEAWYPELNIGVAITDRLGIDGHIGHQNFQDDLQDDYTDWSVGFTYSFEWADLDLRYVDTTDRIGGSEDDAVVFTISKAF